MRPRSARASLPTPRSRPALALDARVNADSGFRPRGRELLSSLSPGFTVLVARLIHPNAEVWSLHFEGHKAPKAHLEIPH